MCDIVRIRVVEDVVASSPLDPRMKPVNHLWRFPVCPSPRWMRWPGSPGVQTASYILSFLDKEDKHR